MEIHDLLLELYGRIPEHVHQAVDGLTVEELTATPEPGCNPIGWIVWHLTRVQDHHVAELLDQPQIWESGDWARRFGVDPDPQNTGFGHGPEEVAAIRPEGPEVLAEYYAAVAARTDDLVRTLDLDVSFPLPEAPWFPPGAQRSVRRALMHIAAETAQHAGHADILRETLDGQKTMG